MITTTALYSNFINSIKSEATKQIYTYCLNRYMQYYHFDKIDQLVKEPQESHKIIEANIIQYIVWLKQDQKLSSVSIELYLSAVMHFYSMNDVVLNRKKIGRYIGEQVRKQKDRAYSTEEIHRLLEFCDERSKALVLLLASTGVRIGAISDLQLRHLRKISEYNNNNLYHVTIYEGTKEEYYCFTTPEAAAAIDVYLDYRRRYGEKLEVNSPLFREQFDVDDLFSIKYPKTMKTRGLTRLLVSQLNRSGVMPANKETEDTRRGKKRNVVARAHGFRKFVTTNMVRAKLNPEAREMLLGHSIGLNKAYYRPGEDEVLSEYLKAVDLLTIKEENRLKIKVEELTEKRNEIQLMKESHEQEMKAMRQEMEKKFQELFTRIDVAKLT